MQKINHSYVQYHTMIKMVITLVLNRVYDDARLVMNNQFWSSARIVADGARVREQSVVKRWKFLKYQLGFCPAILSPIAISLSRTDDQTT
jgi:hypothetical protein